MRTMACPGRGNGMTSRSLSGVRATTPSSGSQVFGLRAARCSTGQTGNQGLASPPLVRYRVAAVYVEGKGREDGKAARDRAARNPRR